MRIISHRGNLNKIDSENENRPMFIEQAIEEGFEVETDVWYVDGFYLGHDKPQYAVSLDWLKSLPLWCHCKNKEALTRLLDEGVHCFWHENDHHTLTSRGIPWSYPDNWVKNGITVVFCDQPIDVPDYILGVCVDNPILWKNRSETK